MTRPRGSYGPLATFLRSLVVDEPQPIPDELINGDLTGAQFRVCTTARRHKIPLVTHIQGEALYVVRPRTREARRDWRKRQSMSVWIPTLPERALSPNGGQRSRRNPWQVAESKLELGSATHHAILATYAPSIPHLNAPVAITLTMYAKHHTRNGDGYYRSTDPANLGGDIAKPIVDALVRMDILDGDDYKVVDEVRLRVRHVDSLEEEGIRLAVEEL